MKDVNNNFNQIETLAKFRVFLRNKFYPQYGEPLKQLIANQIGESEIECDSNNISFIIKLPQDKVIEESEIREWVLFSIKEIFDANRSTLIQELVADKIDLDIDDICDYGMISSLFNAIYIDANNTVYIDL